MIPSNLRLSAKLRTSAAGQLPGQPARPTKPAFTVQILDNKSPHRRPMGDGSAPTTRAALPMVAVTRAALPVVAVTRAALPVIAVVVAATPVTLVACVAVTPEVVVATAPVPVVTPAGIPKLAGAPVVKGWRSGGLCFGDRGRPQTREPQTRGQHER